MNNSIILNKELSTWLEEYPLLKNIIALDETLWINPKYSKFNIAMKNISLSEVDVKEAEERLNRFAPYIAKVFPETQVDNGIIESPYSKNR